jgi:hypothetical protein
LSDVIFPCGCTNDCEFKDWKKDLLIILGRPEYDEVDPAHVCTCKVHYQCAKRWATAHTDLPSILPCGCPLTTRGADFWAGAVDGRRAELQIMKLEENKKKEGEKVDNDSPLAMDGEDVPVFRGKHHINRNTTGLYKADKPRPVLVVDVTATSVRVFVCSSSPRADLTPHRWMAVDSAPTLPTQPPGPIHIRPEGVLAKGKNPTYLCFTHSIEVTPVLQGGDPKLEEKKKKLEFVLFCFESNFITRLMHSYLSMKPPSSAPALILSAAPKASTAATQTPKTKT